MTNITRNDGWLVYIIEADDGSYYTGISTDIERRFRQHAGNKRGARFFNGRKPLRVVYTEASDDRSEASRRESRIKKMSRRQKQALIDAQFTDSEQ